MAGRKVEVLEGELGQLKTAFEEKISDFQNQFSSIHEKMDGRFAALEDLMKKMIDDKQKPASSETIGEHGRGGNPNPSRGRENPKVEVLEGDDGMPPLEPLSREELSRRYDRQEAEYVGRMEEFYRQGAGFERIQRRGADFEGGRAYFHRRCADFERIQRRGVDFEGRREEIHRRGAEFEGIQRRGDDFEERRGEKKSGSLPEKEGSLPLLKGWKEERFSAGGKTVLCLCRKVERKSGSLPEEEGSLPSPRSGEKDIGSLPALGKV
ncbi:hypothetical protein M5K25_018654 [Dendrobium thyrsiflorum]|uniref:Uncharacterized protein n=1 Tax=Dendrobium thyrsiflorum TaxID=117978 RepID=A0ABD0UJJ6_DENTH